MSSYQDIKHTLETIKSLIEEWLQELESNKSDLHKFYKKGNKRAGIRVRIWLQQLRIQAKLLRIDILQLIKERKITKGTKFEENFKRSDRKKT